LRLSKGVRVHSCNGRQKPGWRIAGLVSMQPQHCVAAAGRPSTWTNLLPHCLQGTLECEELEHIKDDQLKVGSSLRGNGAVASTIEPELFGTFF
jgi:hypothetical protein